MSELSKLPTLALRDTVLFPGVTTPLRVGRAESLRAVELALASNQEVFAVLQTGNEDTIDTKKLHNIGTVAKIGQVNRTDGSVQLLVQGQRRANAVRYDLVDGSVQATVQEVVEIDLSANSTLLEALQKEVTERATELATRIGVPGGVFNQALAQVNDPGRFADLVSSFLDVEAEEKQDLLKTLDTEERLRKLLVMMQRQIAVLEAQNDIRTHVQQELGDRQREMVLREQLKAIQKELGDEPAAEDLQTLAERIKALELPPEVRKEVDRELQRLESMNAESMEAQVLRTYLETIVELPWNERSDAKLDLEAAERILDEDHYGLQDVKDRVLEYLAVLQLHEQKATDDAAQRRAPILLFDGPPGVGKTSIARAIAHATGREYVRISLGGARDEADIRGHRRTYVGALPGRIIQGMRQAGTKNPVFLLDEVDKLGQSLQGDPASALLEVLDPAQNDAFVDNYLGVPFDLSEVLFVATANYAQAIPAPLLDRMERIEFSGYTEAEKREIARRYLRPRQQLESGLETEQLTVEDGALEKVISHYTHEAGVRQLEKELGKLCRKVARSVAVDPATTASIDAERVGELLGRPRVHPERALLTDQIGVATGMYYTPVGGDIMFVETTTMAGNGHLVLTGQLGDVMRESAQAAWSYARSHSAELLIDEPMFDRDLHIHVPAGAIPKDGPSAGITLATALISALCGVPARNDIAMTGEVTLTGRVLPIGGVKEKVLGAVRAGIREIILPAPNMVDLEDLTPEVRDVLTVHPVEHLDEVLELSLRGGVFRSSRIFIEGEEPPRMR
ncbi:MAG: endopeptidase La [Planctomycetota bacterium]